MDQQIEAQKAINPGNSLEVILASPRGFCAGVDRAITIVEKALEKFGPPFMSAMNRPQPPCGQSIAGKGGDFVDELDQVPEGAHAIFSAHGVSHRYGNRLWNGILKCLTPHALVTKVHVEAKRYAQKEFIILLIGHREQVKSKELLEKLRTGSSSLGLLRKRKIWNSLHPPGSPT